MASTTKETRASSSNGASVNGDVNYASKIHPDVQRGAVGMTDAAKPIFDMSMLASVPPLNGASPGLGLDGPISERDEDNMKDDDEDGADPSVPFVVNGSGDPTQNRYPHPSLGQMANQGLQGSSEVLTDSLIEIRKHPGTDSFSFPCKRPNRNASKAV
jgi:hypothetical protein